MAASDPPPPPSETDINYKTEHIPVEHIKLETLATGEELDIFDHHTATANYDEGTNSEDESSADDQQPLRRRRRRRNNQVNDIRKKELEQLVIKYMSSKCDDCSADNEEQPVFLNSLQEATDHFATVHKSNRTYLLCCDKKFNTNYKIRQHCMWHQNPESFK